MQVRENNIRLKRVVQIIESVWLEIKSDNAEETRQKILDFGVRKLD